jgi:hypothetical protein
MEHLGHARCGGWTEGTEFSALLHRYAHTVPGERRISEGSKECLGRLSEQHKFMHAVGACVEFESRD